MRSVVVDHIGECDADQRWCGVHESYRHRDSRGCGWFLDALEMAARAATVAAEEIAAALETDLQTSHRYTWVDEETGQKDPYGSLVIHGDDRVRSDAAAIARRIGSEVRPNGL